MMCNKANQNMKNDVLFTDKGKKNTNRKIAEFEAKRQIKLPIDYRTFLLSTNGGCPEPDAFPIRDNPNDSHGLIQQFFSLGSKDEDYDLDENIEVYTERIPVNLLPIATDPGGNILCISTHGEDFGTVYFWDHSFEGLPSDKPDYHNVYFIAESFDRLLDTLIELPE